MGEQIWVIFISSLSPLQVFLFRIITKISKSHKSLHGNRFYSEIEDTSLRQSTYKVYINVKNRKDLC